MNEKRIWKIDRDRGNRYLLAGRSVAICQNMRTVENVQVPNETEIISRQMVPIGEPYISFVSERTFADETVLAEGCSVEGGISLDDARRVAQELMDACELLDQIQRGKTEAL